MQKTDLKIITYLSKIEKYTMFSTLVNHTNRNNTNIYKGQGRILSVLAQNYDYEKEIAQKELQKHLGIKAQSLGETLIKLENQNFIKRKPNPLDKRSMIVSITDDGLNEYKRISSDDQLQQFKFINALDDNDKQEFLRILEKIDNYMKDIEFKQNNNKTNLICSCTSK